MDRFCQGDETSTGGSGSVRCVDVELVPYATCDTAYWHETITNCSDSTEVVLVSRKASKPLADAEPEERIHLRARETSFETVTVAECAPYEVVTLVVTASTQKDAADIALSASPPCGCF
jgi:hypothetical protein